MTICSRIAAVQMEGVLFVGVTGLDDRSAACKARCKSARAEDGDALCM